MRTALVLAAFVGLVLAERAVWADVLPPGLKPWEIDEYRRKNPRPVRPLDIPPPEPISPEKPKSVNEAVLSGLGPRNTIPLIIEGKTTSAIGLRLVLPAKLIKELQNSVASTTGSSRSVPGAGSTVMAGLSLSLAVVCAGLCLVKSRRRLAYGLTVCVVGTFVVIGVGCPDLQKADSNNRMATVYPVEVRKDGNLQGQATVELSNDAESVQVQIDKDKMWPWVGQVRLKTEYAK